MLVPKSEPAVSGQDYSLLSPDAQLLLIAVATSAPRSGAYGTDVGRCRQVSELPEPALAAVLNELTAHRLGAVRVVENVGTLVALTDEGYAAVKTLAVVAPSGPADELTTDLSKTQRAILDAVVTSHLRNRNPPSTSHVRTLTRRAINPQPTIEAVNREIELLLRDHLVAGADRDPSLWLKLPGVLESSWGRNAVDLIEHVLGAVADEDPSAPQFSFGMLLRRGVSPRLFGLACLVIPLTKLSDGPYDYDGDQWWRMPSERDVLLEGGSPLEILRGILRSTAAISPEASRPGTPVVERKAHRMNLAWIDRIGRGIFGEVWRATDSALQRDVAVKFFDGSAALAADKLAIDHARALSRVDCPAVVRVFSLDTVEHPETGVAHLAIVMEYLPGKTLSSQEGPLQPDQAIAIATCLGSAVTAIHCAGLVHGDLHDGNVLVTPSGAKVIDILYTHTLAEFGSKYAHQSREGDLRDLAKLLRIVFERAGAERGKVAEAYHLATKGGLDAAQVTTTFLTAFANTVVSTGSENAKPPTDIEGRVVALIAKLCAGDRISACVAEALALAVESGSQALRDLCTLELTGYSGGNDRTPKESEHRTIQTFVSLGEQINIDYFGGGKAALSWMSSHPKEFPPLKVRFDKPIVEVERLALDSDQGKLTVLSFPARDFAPDLSPGLVMYCYAGGDAASGIVDRLRSALVTRLLELLPK